MKLRLLMGALIALALAGCSQDPMPQATGAPGPGDAAPAQSASEPAKEDASAAQAKSDVTMQESEKKEEGEKKAD